MNRTVSVETRAPLCVVKIFVSFLFHLTELKKMIQSSVLQE